MQFITRLAPLAAPHGTNWELLHHAKNKVKQNLSLASEVLLLKEEKVPTQTALSPGSKTELLSSSSLEFGADT